MSISSHTDGEAFAYFRWHNLRYPGTQPFSKPRPWRLRLWRDGLRSAGDYYSKPLSVMAAMTRDSQSDEVKP